MLLAHPAITSTSSPATCSYNPGTNINDPIHTMTNAHPPPDVQPALLALDSNSTILLAPMPPTHPSISSNSSPATYPSCSKTNLNYPTHPMTPAHPAISSTASPATSTPSPGTNLNYPIHTHVACSSSNIIHLLTCNLLT